MHEAKTRKRVYTRWKPDEFRLLKRRVPKMKKDKIPWAEIILLGGFQEGRKPRQLKNRWEKHLKRTKRKRTG
ncbi:hypothetical protein C5167_049183 [Papaver somniferum]|uniref:Myb-like domain-containing protein n=1 Tax=Papaver somniferum TaxID=3469 RepID=A0A4Y7KK30_PAPSO|nr:hypothetical protein C5167_049183 [Papaver somniferum]